MSSGSIEVVSALDPQLEVATSLKWGVLRGPANAIWKEYKSTTLSDTTMDFNCPPPNSNVYLSPYVMVETEINLVFSCTNTDFTNAGSPNSLVDIGRYDALRAFPVSAITQSANISLNSSTISTNVNSYMAEFMRYRPEMDAERISVQPTMLDNVQSYKDAKDSLFNPLGDYEQSTPSMPGRGTFKPKSISAVVRATDTRWYQTVRYVLTENMLISPFLYNDKPSTQALFGIQNFGLSLQLEKLSRVWSHMDIGDRSRQPALALLATFGEVQIAGAGAVNLGPVQSSRALISWLTPNITQVVPRTNMYPYYQHTPYISTCKYSADAVGTTLDYTTQAISLRVVPNRVFIFVKQRKGDRTFQDTDSYEFINRCSVNFDALEGIFSSASSSQLYQMSADNGLQDTYSAYKDRVGSVLCLSFGSQIALPAGLAPGVSGTFSLSFVLQLTKIANLPKNNSTTDLDCVIVTETAGILQLFDDNSIINVGIISSKQVLEAATETISYDQLSADSAAAVSGGFGIGSLVKKATPVVRAIADAADMVAPFMGEGRKMSGSAKLGGDLVKSSGGAMLSKAQLKRLAMQ